MEEARRRELALLLRGWTRLGRSTPLEVNDDPVVRSARALRGMNPAPPRAVRSPPLDVNDEPVVRSATVGFPTHGP